MSDSPGQATSVLTPPAAEARGVSKSFGATQALHDVSLSVRPGLSHALLGRNGAGKSTLVAILTGLLAPDEGSVLFEGADAPATAERKAWRERVACVYQKSTVIPGLSVAENLFLNAYPGPSLLSWRTIHDEARRLLDQWELGVDVTALAADLTVGQRQLVEIARALNLGTKLMILDEPTAQLEAREIEKLFEQMRRLQADGVTFLYISHHLDEVYEVCQEVTVLRDGEKVLNGTVTGTSKVELIAAMVGTEYVRPYQKEHRPAATHDAAPALVVEDLSVAGACREVSFHVAPGECLGLAGLAGSGTTEVAGAIVGLLPRQRGRITVGGRALRPGRVDLAIDGGIGFVPMDRHDGGFCPNLSVEENLTATVMGDLGRFGFISPRRRRERALQLIDRTGVVAGSPDQLTSELSGGNQQKTVLGRALASDPEVLVLVHPTAGVDVASKEALLQDVAASDLAVLLVSDELDELSVCDRVIVLFGGRITGQFPAGWDGAELVAEIEGVGA